MHGPTHFVTTASRLFPNHEAHVNALRRALASTKNTRLDAAFTAVSKLLASTNNVQKTADLLRAWRGYQAWHRKQGAQKTGSVSPQYAAWQRTVDKKRKAPNGTRTALANVPNDVLMARILPHLNNRSIAQLATANRRTPLKRLRQNMVNKRANVMTQGVEKFVCELILAVLAARVQARARHFIDADAVVECIYEFMGRGTDFEWDEEIDGLDYYKVTPGPPLPSGMTAVVIAGNDPQVGMTVADDIILHINGWKKRAGIVGLGSNSSRVSMEVHAIPAPVLAAIKRGIVKALPNIRANSIQVSHE